MPGVLVDDVDLGLRHRRPHAHYHRVDLILGQRAGQSLALCWGDHYIINEDVLQKNIVQLCNTRATLIINNMKFSSQPFTRLPPPPLHHHHRRRRHRHRHLLHLHRHCLLCLFHLLLPQHRRCHPHRHQNHFHPLPL